MAEELGTKDVLGQLDSRMGNIEQDVRDLRVDMKSGFDRVDREISSLRTETKSGFERVEAKFERIDLRFESQTRWLVGVVFASWLTTMASIWIKN